MNINGLASNCVLDKRDLYCSWNSKNEQTSFKFYIFMEDKKIFTFEENTSRQWLEVSKDVFNSISGNFYCRLEKYYSDNTMESEEFNFLLEDHIWKGKWIAHPQGMNTLENNKPAPMVRKVFTVNKQIKRANLFICGLGFYELRINDKKIQNSFLNQPFTQYDKLVLYDVWSCEESLTFGDNKIDILLGNGWYNIFTRDAWDFNRAPWRNQPKLIFDLEITFEDDSQKIISSDLECLMGTSGVTYNGLRNGEHFDATLKAGSWPKIPDELYTETSQLVSPPGGRLEQNIMNPIICTEKIVPKSIKKIWDDRFLIDFGKNISGFCHLNLKNQKLGTEIILRYGEKLSEQKTLDQRDISKFVFEGEFQTDHYVCGGGEDSWNPFFVYHGFQYVEVSGLSELEEGNIEAWFIHTDLRQVSEIKSSNAVLQWIQDATIQSSLGNYHGIPTDCPQREKNGWTGDVNLSASQLLRNFDSQQPLIKWLRDIKTAQRESGELPGIIPTSGWGFGNGPAWDSVVIELPYLLYSISGHKEILKEMYPSMEKYMKFLIGMSEGNLINYGLGDWCAPNYSGFEWEYHCPNALTSTAIYYRCCQRMAEISKILNEPTTFCYKEYAKKIKEAFQNKFIKEDSKLVSDTQTAYATALYFDLIEPDNVMIAVKNLVQKIYEANNHLDCGILGTKYLFPVLFEHGEGELAYKLLTQTDYPSWGYWQQMGATTMWEHWLGFHSRNHHMFSSVSDCLFQYLAGIQLAEVGYQKVRILPTLIPELDYFKAIQKTPQGNISVEILGEANKVITIIMDSNIEGLFIVPKNYRLKNDKFRQIDLKSGINKFEVIRVTQNDELITQKEI